jgi:hypothetical protein
MISHEQGVCLPFVTNPPHKDARLTATGAATPGRSRAVVGRRSSDPRPDATRRFVAAVVEDQGRSGPPGLDVHRFPQRRKRWARASLCVCREFDNHRDDGGPEGLRVGLRAFSQDDFLDGPFGPAVVQGPRESEGMCRGASRAASNFDPNGTDVCREFSDRFRALSGSSGGGEDGDEHQADPNRYCAVSRTCHANQNNHASCTQLEICAFGGSGLPAVEISEAELRQAEK